MSLNGLVGPLDGGTLLASWPIQQGQNTTIHNLILLGGQDGATFHPILGPVNYKVIGQARKDPNVSDVDQPGDAPKERFTDVLDVSTTGFRSTLVRADLGGTAAYGVSDLKLTTFSPSGTVVDDILYSHMTSLSLDLSLTPADLVNINAASTIPVDLDLSNGDDTVNVEAGVTSDNLSQHYTIHGNGGNDTLTFRKSTATYVYVPMNRPIDAYTIDDGHLTYRTQQSVRPNPAFLDIALSRTIQLDYDGFENVVVNQNVVQGAAFQIGPIGAGKTVTVHGPLPTTILTLIPTVTYNLGDSEHTLDGYLGTLTIDDRARTGTLVLDDTADRRAIAANSDMLGGTVQTNYQVSAANVIRTRTISYYRPDTGWTFNDRILPDPGAEQRDRRRPGPGRRGLQHVRYLEPAQTRNDAGGRAGVRHFHPPLQPARLLDRYAHPDQQRGRRQYLVRRLPRHRYCRRLRGLEPRPHLRPDVRHHDFRQTPLLRPQHRLHRRPIRLGNPVRLDAL